MTTCAGLAACNVLGTVNREAAAAEAEDIATFQMGTHPALTASPIAYPLVNAAELAIGKMQ